MEQGQNLVFLVLPSKPQLVGVSCSYCQLRNQHVGRVRWVPMAGHSTGSTGHPLCTVPNRACVLAPSSPGCSWAVKYPSPRGSTDSDNSHFMRLNLLPALCPPAPPAAERTRVLLFPPSWAPTLPGDCRICPRLCRQLLIPQEPRHHRQEPHFKRVCCQCWAGHRSGTTVHVLTAPPSRKSRGQAVLCPRVSALSDVPLAPGSSASCPMAPAARWCCSPASVSPPATRREWWPWGQC